MKEIQLSQGKSALVDDEDYEYLNQWKWSYETNGYAVRRIYNGFKKPRGFIKMHQIILDKNKIILNIDHKDRNGLNNQKSNLRIATEQQNTFNCGPIKNKSSKYKGVRFQTNMFRSRIRISGKLIHIGCFKSEIRAAWEYDEAAVKYFGEFAYLNFGISLTNVHNGRKKQFI